MIKKKNLYWTITFSLVVLMLSSTMLTVAAQTDNSIPGIGNWQPPQNFVDPVTLKIQQLRTQKLSDDQITTELEKQNMGGDPKTGATWLGHLLTAEEQAKMPISKPAPILGNAKTSQKQAAIASLTQKTAVMRTSGYLERSQRRSNNRFNGRSLRANPKPLPLCSIRRFKWNYQLG